MYHRRIRVEHWANALNQGSAAARNMLAGQRHGIRELPYFFSDQYDLGMEYDGYAADWDRVVIRGDTSATGVSRLLAQGRTRARRHERQHLGPG